jgi:hypothetical protein
MDLPGDDQPSQQLTQPCKLTGSTYQACFLSWCALNWLMWN